MIREQFFEDADGFGRLKSQATFTQTWKFVQEFEQRTGKCIDDGFTQDEYHELFNSMRNRHLRVFYNRKAALMCYIKYLIEHSVLPKEQEEILASVELNELDIKNAPYVVYFKNIAHLQDAIALAINEIEPFDVHIFDIPIAILYLAWYGLTEDEILDLPKSAITENGIVLNGVHILMDAFVVKFLQQLRDSEGYMQQARGVIARTYVESYYLIRSEKNGHLDLNKMRGVLSRMNRASGRKYSLRYDVANRSGIFYRAFLKECNGVHFNLDDPKFASEIFCSDLSNRQKFVTMNKEYQLYKKLFS